MQFCHHEQILYLCLAYISECFACVQSNILVTSCRNALYYSCEEFCWHCCMCTPCCVCKHLQSDVMWSLLWHLFSYQLLGLGIWHVNGFLIHLCVVYSFFGYFFLFFFLFFPSLLLQAHCTTNVVLVVLVGTVYFRLPEPHEVLLSGLRISTVRK